LGSNRQILREGGTWNKRGEARDPAVQGETGPTNKSGGRRQQTWRAGAVAERKGNLQGGGRSLLPTKRGFAANMLENPHYPEGACGGGKVNCLRDLAGFVTEGENLRNLLLPPKKEKFLYRIPPKKRRKGEGTEPQKKKKRLKMITSVKREYSREKGKRLLNYPRMKPKIPSHSGSLRRRKRKDERSKNNKKKRDRSAGARGESVAVKRGRNSVAPYQKKECSRPHAL